MNSKFRFCETRTAQTPLVLLFMAAIAVGSFAVVSASPKGNIPGGGGGGGAGATGPTGATGAVGATGPTGPVGASGPMGASGPAGATVLNQVTGNPATTVTNTTSETTLYTYTVPANTIGSNHRLRLTFDGNILNTSGSSLNFTIKFYWGGSVIFTGTLQGAANNSNPQTVFGEYDIVATGTTNSQEGHVIWWSLSGVANGSVSGATNDYVTTGQNTGLTVDSTSAQVLKITVTMGTASSSATYSQYWDSLELM